MDEEKREEEAAEGQPEVYTVKKDLTGWRFDRRTFLTAAGATAAAAAVGTMAGCDGSEPDEQVVVVEVVATAAADPAVGKGLGDKPAAQRVSGEQPTKEEEPTQPAEAPTESSEQPTATNTAAPEATPTSTSTSTPTPVPEEPQAEFVKDMTIPDGTQMQPNRAFTKTWRYRNSGNVPWGQGVKLVFVDGTIAGFRSNKMGGPDYANVRNVAPGDPVDVSVDLIAPATPGRYRSYWRLQLGNGQWLEENHYAEIVVPAPATPTSPPTATSPPAPTVPACGCDGDCGCHSDCGCDGDCGCKKDKHYWRPN